MIQSCPLTANKESAEKRCNLICTRNLCSSYYGTLAYILRDYYDIYTLCILWCVITAVFELVYCHLLGCLFLGKRLELVTFSLFADRRNGYNNIFTLVTHSLKLDYTFEYFLRMSNWFKIKTKSQKAMNHFTVTKSTVNKLSVRFHWLYLLLFSASKSSAYNFYTPWHLLLSLCKIKWNHIHLILASERIVCFTYTSKICT